MALNIMLEIYTGPSQPVFDKLQLVIATGIG